MSSQPHPSWQAILDETQTILTDYKGRGCNVAEHVDTEDLFIAAFEQLCKERAERRKTRLGTNLADSFENIQKLISTIDEVGPDGIGSRPDERLEDLWWRLLFMTIAQGCEAHLKLDDIIQNLVHFNTQVPAFAKVDQFPDDKHVQKPLQDAIVLLRESYLYIFDLFLKAASRSELASRSVADLPQTLAGPDEELENIPTIPKTLDEKAKRIEEARGRHANAFDQAVDLKRRAAMRSEQPTLERQRDQPSVIHGGSNEGTEIHIRFMSMKMRGGGDFGEVDEVREMSTGASYARKHIHRDKTLMSEKDFQNQVETEVTIMQRLRHQHIALFLFHTQEKDPVSQEVNAYSIFMLPLADCDLLEFLQLCEEEDYPAARNKQITSWFGCLLEALAFAHKLDVRHRDIKPSNILINNGRPYLTDFGLSKDTSSQSSSSSRGKPLGTPRYRAPELLPNEERGRRADVFSLGCVYCEMFTVSNRTSISEFDKAREDKVHSKAFREFLDDVNKWLTQFLKDNLSDMLVDLILSMMTPDKECRPTAQQALNSLRREPAFFCVE